KGINRLCVNLWRVEFHRLVPSLWITLSTGGVKPWITPDFHAEMACCPQSGKIFNASERQKTRFSQHCCFFLPCGQLGSMLIMSLNDISVSDIALSDIRR